MACLKFLLNEKLGLSAMYPNNSIHLMSTAAVLPLSTAEVERVFSKVKLVKCDHINRMKQVTMNNILYVKLNCNKQCYEQYKDVTGGQTDERKVALLHVYPFATSLAKG
jgi:hypothetical protein